MTDEAEIIIEIIKILTGRSNVQDIFINRFPGTAMSQCYIANHFDLRSIKQKFGVLRAQYRLGPFNRQACLSVESRNIQSADAGRIMVSH